MSAVEEDIIEDIQERLTDPENMAVVDASGISQVVDMTLSDFIDNFNEGLLNAIEAQNPPIYSVPDPVRDGVMDTLKRAPFPAQREVVQAVSALLIDQGEDAAIINAEMGTGKTMMAIAAAAVLHEEGYQRCLVLSPPHLVYKWKREILNTIPNAKVWVLNSADTLVKLIALKDAISLNGMCNAATPEFYILGRVRMRLGFNWKPAYAVRRMYERVQQEEGNDNSPTFLRKTEYCACPDCAKPVTDADGNYVSPSLFPNESRLSCRDCGSRLWVMCSKETTVPMSKKVKARKFMMRLPGIGEKTADFLIGKKGEDAIDDMLSDNIYEFINMLDDDGNFIFTDRQAARIEKALQTLEYSVGNGSYQPSEFIKRYLPEGYFGLMVTDEGHEYKNQGSAQGQAMGVLAGKCSKQLLLTGTLMGGYASDIFFLLWRILPRRMMEDGYVYTGSGSLGPAAMSFLEHHGILQDVYKEKKGSSHRTALGSKVSVSTKKKPGFGPKGIARYVLPYTVFLKLKDIGADVLPGYDEHFINIPMISNQAVAYEKMEGVLRQKLKEALAKRDNTLMGVVLNVLLAWPDCCFRPEAVKHPRTRELLHFVGRIFDEDEVSPKEQELIRLCKQSKADGKRTMVYSVYSGKRDTTARLKRLLEEAGLKVAVLRSTVPTDKREDWVEDQVDRGIDVLITNPELVKTGLDMLAFPVIVFMQTGYNVYTMWQASRRSWRIGQEVDVDVYFLGYDETAQIVCLTLMAQKIAVAQSTSGDMPETGLDVLNQAGDSIEVELAKRLLKAA